MQWGLPSELIVQRRRRGRALQPGEDAGVHRPGRVYVGRECFTRITKSEAREVSLVTDLVQKYSVVFTQGGDQHDCAIIAGIADMVAGPFDPWLARWTTALHPHALFDDYSRSGPCPCGSPISYGGCCGPNPGVKRPHLDVALFRPPPSGAPTSRFAGYEAAALARLERSSAPDA